MDNLKYPKVSYLHNEAPAEVFGLISTNHAWKTDGHIFKATDLAANKISVTHDGATSALFFELDTAVACLSDCKFEAGFAIKREYHTPGRGNAYIENHPYSRPYIALLDESHVSSGAITSAGVKKVYSDILAIMKKDYTSLNEAQFATGHKAVFLAAASGKTVTIVLDGVSIGSKTLAAGEITPGVIVTPTATGFMMIATGVGSYMEVTPGADVTLEKEGIAVLGVSPEMQVEVPFTKQFDFSDFYFTKIVLPSGNVAMNDYSDGAGKYYTGTASGIASSLNTDHFGAVAVSTTLYVGFDQKGVLDVAILPVNKSGTATVMPTSVLVAGAKGRWPLNTAKLLNDRFIGATTGMEGMRQNYTNLSERYVVLGYVIVGTTSSLSDGASYNAGFKTRVDEVVSYSAIQSNANLSTIVKVVGL